MYFRHVLSDATNDKPNSGLSAVMKNLTVLERKRNCCLRNISTESLTLPKIYSRKQSPHIYTGL
jgi:hypothetical protein